MCIWIQRQRSLLKRSRRCASPQEAIQELQRMEQTLDQAEKHYHTLEEGMTQDLRAAIRDKQARPVLLSLCRRRRMLRQRREQLLGQREQVFGRRLSLEKMNMASLHVKSLRQVLRVCTDMMKALHVDDVEKILEDLQDVDDARQAVDDTLEEATLLGAHDEEAMERELATLASELSMSLPVAPTSPPSVTVAPPRTAVRV